MNGYDSSRPESGRVSSGLVGTLLIGIGIVIGVVVASDFGWMPFGHAVPEAPLVKSAPPVPSVAPSVGVNGGEQTFVHVAKVVRPAVVSVFSTRTGKGEGPHAMPFDDPFFRRFFGDEFFRRFEQPPQRKERGLGSGVIVESNGFIVTNNHVVSKADEIKVFLSDKREFKAKLIGTDAKTDIAVLKIEADGLHTIAWADSDKLEVGEFVLAVGNPFGLTHTVTLGIVSALGRAAGIAEYEDFIQTDAAINPGNSGGALVNARGELAGINTAIFSQSGGNMGIGFAVPSNLARSIMEQLVKHGKVVRGWLGVSIQDLSPELASQFGLAEPKGVLVSEVLADSPARKAGLERGDVIVEYDGKPVENATQLRNVVAQTLVGKKAVVKFMRDKKVRTAEVAIVEQPKNVAQAGNEEAGEAAPLSGRLSDLDVRELTPELAARFGLGANERGVVIAKVRQGSAAEESGLKEGDLMLEVNRQPTPTLKAYERAASKLGAGQAVLLLIKRQGHPLFVTLKP
ncbi:MAG: DegQ family serine endoprotease [Nitrospiraceae bacterium]|nr:DegQ family serine endoprotease [Nitrospiraceae bacterium]